MDEKSILKRIDELLAPQIGGERTLENAAQLAQGATSLLASVYGPASPHLDSFTQFVEAKNKEPKHQFGKSQELALGAKGVLSNLRFEIQAGLIGSVRQQVAGDVLTDFVRLARTALGQKGDDAKNVAAVLAAAAFEDTIRRIGESLAGVVGQDDLSDVLNKLKTAGVIQSPQIGIAQSYLSFRNHALHANWDKIQREAVQSVLGFVEQLLLKHFH